MATAGRLAAQTDYQWQDASSGGLWSSSGNWNPAGPASGSTNSADFSTLLLPGNNTVHLDLSETIGSLFFGDVGNTYNWALDNDGSGANVLTLGGAASITVENDTATISAVLGGSAGLSVSSLPFVTNNNGQIYNLGGPTGFPATYNNIATPGTLVLNPAAVESYTGGTTVTSGVLLLDFSNLATPTNMISSGSALVVDDGACRSRINRAETPHCRPSTARRSMGRAPSRSASTEARTTEARWPWAR